MQVSCFRDNGPAKCCLSTHCLGVGFIVNTSVTNTDHFVSLKLIFLAQQFAFLRKEHRAGWCPVGNSWADIRAKVISLSLMIELSATHLCLFSPIFAQ